MKNAINILYHLCLPSICTAMIDSRVCGLLFFSVGRGKGRFFGGGGFGYLSDVRQSSVFFLLMSVAAILFGNNENGFFFSSLFYERAIWYHLQTSFTDVGFWSPRRFGCPSMCSKASVAAVCAGGTVTCHGVTESLHTVAPRVCRGWDGVSNY